MFLNLAKRENKQTLLELGAGAGYDSLNFMNNGLTVTAVDLSTQMVKCCLEKGINARELDFYRLSELKQKYDCVYAINTLLHVPKSDLPDVLRQIDTVLGDDGLFYLGLYGGDDNEGIFSVNEISDAQRFFIFYSSGYLKEALSNYFDIVRFETVEVGEEDDRSDFHSVILRKKK